MQNSSPAISRAQELLRTVRHAAMATVNEDGSPHNTPYLFMRNDDLTKIYWGSHPSSLHSRNITRTGKLFIVLYEANDRGGLYIAAENGHACEGAELDEALAIHNKLRAAANKDLLQKAYYEKGPQRMWVATVTGMWVNGSSRDSNGQLIEDIRTPVTAAQLLNT